MFKKFKLRFILFSILILFLLFLPNLFTSSFALTLFSKMGVLIIFSVAYNMLLGQTGLLSFGHAIYFGLAGYASIHILSAINELFTFFTFNTSAIYRSIRRINSRHRHWIFIY